MEIFTRITIPSFVAKLLFCKQNVGTKSSFVLKFAVIVMLLASFQVKVFAQCNNAVSAGDFSALPIGEYNSIGDFTPGVSGDKIYVVNNNGSKGAHIKGKLFRSLKQTLKLKLDLN